MRRHAGGRIQNIARADVLDAAIRRQTVLCEPDAAASQFGLDLFVLCPVEPVRVQKGFEAFRTAAVTLLASRQQVVEQLLHHAGEFSDVLASGREAVELGAPRG